MCLATVDQKNHMRSRGNNTVGKSHESFQATPEETSLPRCEAVAITLLVYCKRLATLVFNVQRMLLPARRMRSGFYTHLYCVQALERCNRELMSVLRALELRKLWFSRKRYATSDACATYTPLELERHSSQSTLDECTPRQAQVQHSPLAPERHG